MEEYIDKKQIKILYKAYLFNKFISIYIALIIAFVLINFTGVIDVSGYGIILDFFVFVFAIFAHIQGRKLKIRSTGPVLIYLSELLGLISTTLTFVATNQNTYGLYVAVLIINIISLLVRMIAAILTFLTAKSLKGKYPNLIQDYQKTRKSVENTK
ncbi:hypothetical protein [Lactococcus kimchii]|uniref:hypothetical protein n=1 Tax=Lactococcus sp. S-13 TaxID=2507158 RepID=UPI001023630D|nr:hypothetical protein [Lactococcus sp. S-13]RZI49638.1 hypothetical protein EQJ87_09490 [Lactococcus sp. S-13]